MTHHSYKQTLELIEILKRINAEQTGTLKKELEKRIRKLEEMKSGYENQQ